MGISSRAAPRHDAGDERGRGVAVSDAAQSDWSAGRRRIGIRAAAATEADAEIEARIIGGVLLRVGGPADLLVDLHVRAKDLVVDEAHPERSELEAELRRDS